MPTKERPQHSAGDFDLDILSDETDLFRWFLLCYLFGKPIQSNVAVATWQRLIAEGLDTPWAIVEASSFYLVSALHDGGYTRYQHATADGLKKCMDRLIRDYEGSLELMMGSSEDAAEVSKRLQELYGVGPKIAEIFLNDLDEYFARRVE